jgi:hypothetical protein
MRPDESMSMFRQSSDPKGAKKDEVCFCYDDIGVLSIEGNATSHINIGLFQL